MSKPTVIVTGASRGLGAATARIAAQMASNVVLTSRSEDELQAVAQEIELKGGSALVMAGDIRQEADCQRIVAGTVHAFGQIDAIANNAGVIAPIAPVADGDPRAWQENWEVNLLGPVMLTQAAMPYLRRSQGRIINVSAGAAVKVFPTWAAYSSAKAALNQFTRVLAAEEPEITVIAFRPGAVNTAMQETIRREGAQVMPADVYARFVRYYEEDGLLPPEVPGCALAVLSFYAPREWSGTFLAWNSEEVQSLVRQYACSPGR
jgi:NAD(P)-dependent dehydrogenase (short-subunit alcohol dehydrogenase family)